MVADKDQYCINCKYALESDYCRRDGETALNFNTKACIHFVKCHRQPSDPDIITSLGLYRDNAELAVELQKVNPIYFDESKNFWAWQKKEKYYKRIDETQILSKAHTESGKYFIDYTSRKEIITAIQITGRERELKEVPINWIHCKDFVFDLNTKEQFKATPEYFYPAPIPHKIGLDESTPTIDKLFIDWMGEDAIKLYEICSYCLIDAYPIHRMFILFGRGRNGKGQFLNFLERFIGSNNTVSTDLELLCDSRFESAKLYKMKLATIGETDFNAIKNTGKLKMLTGDDKIGGEFKGKDLFNFHNTAKMVIASNGLPESLDKSDGFNSRCIILEFKNQFDEGKSIIDTISELEYENFLLKCLNILPGLLERGRFTNEGTIEEKGKKYESLSNPFPTFKENELIEDLEIFTPLDIIREKYSMFLARIHHRPTNYTAFTQTLHKNGYSTGKEYINNGQERKQERVVYGLKLKIPSIDLEGNIIDNKTSKTTKTSIPTNPIYREELESSVLPVLPVLEQKNHVTELTELLNKSKVFFEQSRGVINSSNIVPFSLWFCEQYHPIWKVGKESGEYTPSAIKGIASKLFALTPGGQP